MTDIVVCNKIGESSPFLDNIEGKCDSCNTGIYYRPHAPKDAIKLCAECTIPFLQKHGKETIVGVTEETMKDLEQIEKN